MEIVTCIRLHIRLDACQLECNFDKVLILGHFIHVFSAGYKKINKAKIKSSASRVDLTLIKRYLRPIKLGLKGELQEEIAF